jgi:hypothetical protein
MPGNLNAMESFSTLHSLTTALPAEITLQIIKYVSAGTQLDLMGGGLGSHRVYHPIASVSRALRRLYLSQPYSTAPVRYNIGEVLHFNDLQTLASFFREGPGQHAALLLVVRYISVSYVDDHAASWWRTATDYAYEAFELLYRNWHLMSVSWLRLHLPHGRAVVSVDDPGIWSLLKIRALARLDILGPRGCIAPDVRAHLKSRTRKKNLFPWRPLGVENPGPSDWENRVKYGGIPDWRAQFEWLGARYEYKHDRETVAARRAKQRAGYHKRRRRWPMLSKRRRKRL